MYKFLLAAMFIALSVAVSPSAFAQDPQDPILTQDEEEEETLDDVDMRSCISTRRIRRTRVVDDRNVLFYTSGGQVFHNVLRSPCHGLKRENRFSYRTTGSQLCERDAVGVLMDDAFGFRTGSRCSLGEFRVITREEADALIEGPQVAPPADLPMPNPEEVGVEGETS